MYKSYHNSKNTYQIEIIPWDISLKIKLFLQLLFISNPCNTSPIWPSFFTYFSDLKLEKQNLTVGSIAFYLWYFMPDFSQAASFHLHSPRWPLGFTNAAAGNFSASRSLCIKPSWLYPSHGNSTAVICRRGDGELQ